MSSPSLLPTRASFASGRPVSVEVLAPDGVTGALVVRRLGEAVAREERVGRGIRSFDGLAPGGYGVELEIDGEVAARTAIEVTDDARSRLRYGFVASYRPDKDADAVARFARRLHLNAIQFYDWAYRHADLHGGGAEYRDALDQPISLGTVRRLIEAVHAVGADALGYAAVYAVGPDEWGDWKQHALVQATGEPYGLGDFLFLLDPAAPEWVDHFGGELAHAVSHLGFDGFHLDQYGYPRRAVRADGARIDVSDSFVTLIERVREHVPDARLVFNNVNDFPTWKTARAAQDAVYIEVWEPHTTLSSLASVVSRARVVGAGKPVVIAAYQHVYDTATADAADPAVSFTMATLFSHGATQLLAGEAGRLLVDPYYVRNQEIEQSTLQLLTRWYDFLVEHDELLMPSDIVDVTGSWVGEYNDELDVSYDDASVGANAVPGTVWRRVTQTGDRRLVLHLINLVGQHDELWDGPKSPPAAIGTGTLRIRRVGEHIPRVRVADPDREGTLRELPVDVTGDRAVVTLPEPHVWQLVLIDL